MTLSYGYTIKSKTTSPGHFLLMSSRIQAFQVEISDDDSLQFNPCFFRPYPEKLLHLLHFAELDYWKRGRNPDPPNFDGILKKAQKDFPNGDYLKNANANYNAEIDDWASREKNAIRRAQELFDYIDHQLNIAPDDQPEDFCLRSPRDLEFWE